MSGYARAHRGRWDHPLFKNKQEAAVWAWMCDTARFRQHAFQTRFGIVTLERGQLLVSQRTISDDFGLGRQQVRRLIDSMVIAGMITENSTHSASRAGTIISIANYERYQSDNRDCEKLETQGQPKGKPITNPRPTQGQPTREEREKREERKEESPSDSLIAETRADPFFAPAAITDLAPSLDEVAVAFGRYGDLRRSFMPTARNLSFDRDRQKKMAARLRDIGGLAGWDEVLALIRESPWLRGEVSDRPFAPIDWLLKPENLRKVRERNYNNERQTSAGRPGSSGSTSPIDAMRAARATLGLDGPDVRQ